MSVESVELVQNARSRTGLKFCPSSGPPRTGTRHIYIQQQQLYIITMSITTKVGSEATTCLPNDWFQSKGDQKSLKRYYFSVNCMVS